MAHRAAGLTDKSPPAAERLRRALGLDRLRRGNARRRSRATRGRGDGLRNEIFSNALSRVRGRALAVVGLRPRGNDLRGSEYTSWSAGARQPRKLFTQLNDPWPRSRGRRSIAELVGRSRPAADHRSGQRRRRLPLVRNSHHLVPDFRWQAAARRAVHRLTVVIADPNAGRQLTRVADEPGIAEILSGARLAGSGPIGKCCSPPRAIDDDRIQHLVQGPDHSSDR